MKRPSREHLSPVTIFIEQTELHWNAITDHKLCESNWISDARLAFGSRHPSTSMHAPPPDSSAFRLHENLKSP